ncbi:MAG: transcriptional regulator [Desulfobulbaceae bacterium A2]|nr:MAG: transcriptional regulator [Desulfobulbaceae bacterium A2]
MPIYEYECKGCAKVFEVQQRMSESPLEQCPDCGAPVKKLVSRSAFHLKGGGWYSDGYSGGAPCKPEPAGGGTAVAAKSEAAPACPSGGCCSSCPAAA